MTSPARNRNNPSHASRSTSPAITSEADPPPRLKARAKMPLTRATLGGEVIRGKRPSTADRNGQGGQAAVKAPITTVTGTWISNSTPLGMVALISVFPATRDTVRSAVR